MYVYIYIYKKRRESNIIKGNQFYLLDEDRPFC